jgi:hypothetical protein
MPKGSDDDAGAIRSNFYKTSKKIGGEDKSFFNAKSSVVCTMK